jgi:hypothetical protein
MDDIWKKAAKKIHAKQNQAAIHSTATATTAIPTVQPTTATGNLSATPPDPTPLYDAETMTLEQLAETCHQLV